MVTRSVIVTGGLGGIGLAVAHGFAAEHANILLVDAREDDRGACDALVRAGAARALAVTCDVAEEEAVHGAVARARDAFKGLDVLVNVAGMMIYKPIATLTAADWARVLGLNLVGAALFTGEAFRHMRPGGCIINVASVHARRTSPLVAPSAASKAALVSLTRSAAIEGKALGIRVNAILPGAIDTPMLHASPNIRSGAEVLDPADVGTPVDIAALAVFLASDGALFITGEDIVADGGRMGKL